MAVITCPGCEKQYQVSADAAGKVAKCAACGKRFRLGKQSGLAGPNANAAMTQPQTVNTAPAAAAAPVSHASFADEFELEPPVVARTAMPDKVRVCGTAANAMLATQSPPAKKKRKKRKQKKTFRWGFQWEKVAGGGATFLIAGVIAVALLIATGRIYVWPVIIAVGGFFTMLTGLMGEEGIW